MSRTVLFLCPHNAAKSVIAAAYFQYLADRAGLDLRAVSAGTEPEAAVWPAVVALLQADGLAVPDQPPRRVTAQDLAAATRIIAMGCTGAELGLPESAVEQWDDVPLASQDLPGARAAIRAHVEQLIAELRAG